DPKIKEKAADYLMREGELTGAEYFAVMHGLPQALNGVEDMRYYAIHRDLFRHTWPARQPLVKTLEGLRDDLLALRSSVYSRAVADLQTQTDAYRDGQV